LTTPEQEAREAIDAALAAAGWQVQDPRKVNLRASRGVAVTEFPLRQGYGHADYLLFVDGRAAGVVEAKKEGTTLAGVETQTEKYGKGFPDSFPAAQRPLPFLYESTGVETFFTNRLDPRPRGRPCRTPASGASRPRRSATSRPRSATTTGRATG